MNKYDALDIKIPGQGNGNADIMIVGEAGGKEEEIAGKPFVGPSGKLLDSVLRSAGISREECWVTNVVKYRPPNNLFKLVKNLSLWQEYLIDEVKAINPKIILALGGEALFALTGQRGISSWRGSILKNDETGKRVIPTFHPAFILRSESMLDRSIMEFDVKRLVVEQSYEPVPDPNLLVIRDAGQLYRYLERFTNEFAAADIETYRSVPICLGIAPSKHEGISVPLFSELWGQKFCDVSDYDLAERWRMLDKFLREKKIIWQNGKFDENKLTQMGFRPNYYADTMLMAHTLYPELPKGLAFLASIHTRHPYYKLEGKEFHPKKDSPDRLFLYNAKDCVVDFEIYEVLHQELIDSGLHDFYYNFVNHFHKLYLDIEKEGVLVDMEVRAALHDKYDILFQENQRELEALVGHPVNVNSNPQVTSLLYDELGLPVRKGNTKPKFDKEGNLVQSRGADEKVLTGLQAQFGEKKPKIVPIIDKILRGRVIKKTLSTYVDACPDYDGRHKTNYQIVGTETGRTSTRILRPPMRPEPIGMGFQVIVKNQVIGGDVLEMFIPDPGYVYLEPDLSQAEARIVDLLSEDYEGLEEYETIDKHIKTARIVLGLGDDYQMTKKSPERFLGKKSRHAGGYDMGKREAMLNWNTDAKKYGIDFYCSEWKAGQYLERFHAAYPKIRQVFHKQIQDALARNNKTLVNPFGRVRRFSARWGDQLFKEAYATIPQGTVGDVVKRAALYYRSVVHSSARIVMEKHDALGCLVPVNEVEAHARVLRDGLEMPIDFSQCSLPRRTLIIPAEFEVGEKNFKKLVDYKIPD